MVATIFIVFMGLVFQEALVEVAGVGVSSAFPIAGQLCAVGQVDFRHPFDPFVAPFSFGDELEGVASLRGDGDVVHLVGKHDGIVHDVREGKGRRVAVVRGERDRVGGRVG